MLLLDLISIRLGFIGLILYQIYSVYGQCVDNHLSLADEADNVILNEYLVKLEWYSGLSKYKPVIPVRCPKSQCEINSQGSAVWETRLNFYSRFTKNSSLQPDEKTLDGCLCHSRNNNSFQNCMVEVRSIMSAELDKSFVLDLTRIIERNHCKNYGENCINN
ncbi:unnamed protein product [Phyllotreta striolata]|uniref:Uncharacterized protein n=1 Tax=Phyllotreta striolata TaxID=444603 RepID=A0A9N9TM42_PHYSR|nr:unnamed protein product [Phyllotreta striolata]